MSGQDRPEWCVRLHELADSAQAAVASAGWDVGLVAIVIRPTGGDEGAMPLVVKSAVSGAKPVLVPPPPLCRSAM